MTAGRDAIRRREVLVRIMVISLDPACRVEGAAAVRGSSAIRHLNGIPR
ncbi:hypothetical protein [Xylanimonas protaetiae]|nr:hypothetical protein [Xylanimonas protaetiae]